MLRCAHFHCLAESGKTTAPELSSWIDDGYEVIALIPSCVSILKYEWPLIVDKDDHVKKLSNATFYISEYIGDIAKKTALRMF